MWSTRFDRWDSIHFDYRRRWWASEKRQPGRAAGLGLMADMADCSAACHHRRCRPSSKTIFPRINLRANPNQRINIRGGEGMGKEIESELTTSCQSVTAGITHPSLNIVDMAYYYYYYYYYDYFLALKSPSHSTILDWNQNQKWKNLFVERTNWCWHVLVKISSNSIGC